MSIFFIRFSSRDPICSEKMISIGCAVDLVASTVPRAQSQPSSFLRISEPYYDGFINKEYGSRFEDTLPSEQTFREFGRAQGITSSIFEVPPYSYSYGIWTPSSFQIRLPGRCGGQRQKTALPLLTTMYTVHILR